MKNKIITGLMVIVVIIGLVWLAQVLVGNFDIVQLLKTIHGG